VHDLRLRTRAIQRHDLAQQLAQLDAASCTKIYREKVAARLSSGPSSSALGALDAGNVLMVTSTDRLARNTRDFLNILYAVKSRCGLSIGHRADGRHHFAGCRSYHCRAGDRDWLAAPSYR